MLVVMPITSFHLFLWQKIVFGAEIHVMEFLGQQIMLLKDSLRVLKDYRAEWSFEAEVGGHSSQSFVILPFLAHST